MRVEVAVFKGPEQILSYYSKNFIPEGTRVAVPLRSRIALGIVVETKEGERGDLKEIKEILDEIPTVPSSILKLTKWAASYYLEPWALFLKTALPPSLRSICPLREPKEKWVFVKERQPQKLTPRQKELLQAIKEKAPIRELVKQGFSKNLIDRLVKKGILQIEEKTPTQSYPDTFISDSFLTLTPAQREVFERVKDAIGSFKPFLLFGITGSGKTEVYLHWAKRCLEIKKSVLVLIPEISLTPQYIKRFSSRFGQKVAVIHSALSYTERFHEWLKVKKSNGCILLGTRSAVFAPLENLGLIIVDEEHDVSFKQETSPKYNARDLAVVRAKIQKCPVVLASATPSLESYYNAIRGKYTLLELKERVKGALPKTKIVDMRGKKEKGIFSELLLHEMKKSFSQKRQVLILLNRRGYAPYLICKNCGRALKCPNCDITLTLHKSPWIVKCHYCGYIQEPQDYCICGSELDTSGIGIQQIQEEISCIFPEVRIERMDRDRIKKKLAHWEILGRLEHQEVEVLLGTQMVAKGHDYPGIYLVGVPLADYGLHIPDFRSAERVFQLITQVIGRAGRLTDGRAIIQTYMPDHYAIKYAACQDYLSFAKEELKRRKKINYPPFAHLARIIITGEKPDKVKEVAFEISSCLSNNDQSITLLGPSSAPIFKLKNRYRWHILVKAKKKKELLLYLSKLPRKKRSTSVSIDIDPYNML